MYEPTYDYEYDYDGEPGEADSAAAANEEYYDSFEDECHNCGEPLDEADAVRHETRNFDVRLPNHIEWFCPNCDR